MLTSAGFCGHMSCRSCGFGSPRVLFPAYTYLQS